MKESEPITRRELFSQLTKPFGDSLARQRLEEKSEAQHPQLSDSSLNRRQFLISAGATGLAVAGMFAFPGKGITEGQSRTRDDPEQSNQNQGNHSVNEAQYQPQEQKNTRLETVLQAGVVGAAEAGLIPTAQRLRLPVEKFLTTTDLKLLEKGTSPLSIALNLTAVPAVEEAIFRLAPNSIFTREGKDLRWDVGIPISLANTAYRLYTLYPSWSEQTRRPRKRPRKQEEKTGMAGVLRALLKPISRFERKIPLFAFLNNALYWYEMRRKGYGDAVVAHITVNSAFLGVGRFLNLSFEKTPPPKRETRTRKRR